MECVLCPSRLSSHDSSRAFPACVAPDSWSHLVGLQTPWKPECVYSTFSPPPPPTFLWCLSHNGFIEGSVGPSVGMARDRFVWEGTRGDQRPPDEQKGGKEHVPAITGSPRILNSAFCWEGRPPFSVLGPCFSCGAVRAPLLL